MVIEAASDRAALASHRSQVATADKGAEAPEKRTAEEEITLAQEAAVKKQVAERETQEEQSKLELKLQRGSDAGGG